MIKAAIFDTWYCSRNSSNHSINDEVRIVDMEWKSGRVKVFSVSMGKEYWFSYEDFMNNFSFTKMIKIKNPNN